MLAPVDAPIEHSHDELERVDAAVKVAIEDAAMAPFHYDRGSDGIPEPWRFYILEQDKCRFLSRKLGDWFSDMKPSNKLPSMLADCAQLVLITWKPQFPGLQDSKQLQIDEEHLAATAAATQNFLLSLTASDFATYWSSGGYFRTPSVFEKLGIPQSERLLAAIFINPKDQPNDTEVIPGKLREERSSPEFWVRKLMANSSSD